MSARKPKAELVAIYRLEFYKKQKSWKLSDTRRKQHEQIPEAVNPETILNETYSIETEENADSALNKAFLDTGSGDRGVSREQNLPEPPTLSIQSLDPITACEECHRASSQDKVCWDQWADDQEPRDQEMEVCGEWPIQTMVWSNSAMQEAWKHDMPLEVEGMQSDESQQLYWGEDAQVNLWSDDQLWVPEEGGAGAAERFLRGARRAPHSSELQLAPHADADVSRMSGEQLAAGLRGLLREADQRQRYRSTLSLDASAASPLELPPRLYTNFSCEDLPTRDIGLAPFDFPPFLSPTVPHVTQDPFLAGSHMNRPCLDDFVGRGRGRLGALPPGWAGAGAGAGPGAGRARPGQA